MVWSVEMLPAAFERGLAIPARLRLLRDGVALDLRSEARRGNAFWAYFRDVAFARVEMRAAIQRLVAPTQSRSKLLKSLAGFSHVPEAVGESFRRLSEDFWQITVAICRDPECDESISRHAHAYTQGRPLKNASFRSQAEARTWVRTSRGIISSSNEAALLRRIGDWPGMPEGPPSFVHLGI